MLALLRSYIPGRFDPALEAAYQDDLADEKLRVFFRTSLLCAALYLGFAVLDHVAMPGNALIALAIRLTVVAVISVAMLAVRARPQAFLRHYSLFTCLIYLWCGIGIDAIILLTHQGDPARDSYYAGLILVSLALYTWTYLHPLYAALVGLALVSSYLGIGLGIQHLREGHDYVVLLENSFFLIGANVIGAFAVYLRERFSRQAFLLKNALSHDLRLEEEAKRQSEYLSEHDPLTGLPNRVRFMRRLGEMIAATRGGASVAVLFLDLNDFKQINDQHGHAAGDEVLRCVAERVRAAIRATDLAARLGGDEFVIALPLTERQGPAIIERVSATLRTAIAEPVQFQGASLCTSSSIGAAVYPQQGASAEELLHAADQFMYQAKRHRSRARAA